MLVGEHGRVIPLRRFKEVVIAVIAITFLSLAAMAVLVVLYSQQGNTVDRLQSELNKVRLQAAQLKDEKDVLHAKLVIKEINAAPETQPDDKKEKVAAPSAAGSASESSSDQESLSDQDATETEKPSPAVVNWQADIRQFEVDYDYRREILQSRFRIYNTSSPKQTLSGRIVLVFKNSDDPPIKWLAVPNVPLKDGRPVGKAGQAFSVRNFRTMTFKAFKPRRPITYNLVTVFVYTADGELLLSRDMGFTLPPEPPAAPETETPSKPVEGETAPTVKPEDRKAPADTNEPTPVMQIPSLPQAGRLRQGGTAEPGTGKSKLSTGNNPSSNDSQPSPAPVVNAADTPDHRSETEQPIVEGQPKPEGDRQ